jgi:hypothetical protein
MIRYLMELKTKAYDLYEYGSGYYRVVVFDKNLARRVNNLLGEYEDYKFQDGDEPVFKFSENQLANVLKALKVSN